MRRNGKASMLTTATAKRHRRLPRDEQYLQEQARLGRTGMAEALAGLRRCVPQLIDVRAWVRRHPNAGVLLLGLTAAATGVLGARLRRSPPPPAAPLNRTRQPGGLLLGPIRALWASAWRSVSRAAVGLALAGVLNSANQSTARLRTAHEPTAARESG